MRLKTKYRVDRYIPDIGWIAASETHICSELAAREQLHQFRMLDKDSTYRLTRLITVTAEELVTW